MKQRRRFDAVIASLIAEARADYIGDRKDVLALLLQARYEGGEPISDEHITDELLTLLGSARDNGIIAGLGVGAAEPSSRADVPSG